MSNHDVHAEMDAVDPIAEMIRDRRAGVHHPTIIDLSGPPVRLISELAASEISDALDEIGGAGADFLLPHAGDDAIDEFAGEIAVSGLDAALLSAIMQYDRWCADAERLAGIDVDSVDCADLGTLLVALSDHPPGPRDVIACYILSGMRPVEVRSWMEMLSQLTTAAKNQVAFGASHDDIIEANEEASDAASDIVWRDLCSRRHPEALSSDEAVVMELTGG